MPDDKKRLKFIQTNRNFTIISQQRPLDYITILPYYRGISCAGDYYNDYETQLPHELDYTDARVYFGGKDYTLKVVIPRKRNVILENIANASPFITFTYGPPCE